MTQSTIESLVAHNKRLTQTARDLHQKFTKARLALDILLSDLVAVNVNKDDGKHIRLGLDTESYLISKIVVEKAREIREDLR